MIDCSKQFPTTEMENAKMVFIPGPGMGHLVSAVEMGKLLIDRDERLSVTFLIIQLPFDTGVDAYINSLTTTDAASRMRFMYLPQAQRSDSSNAGSTSKSQPVVSFDLISIHKLYVREAILDIMRSNSALVACIIVDMFCVSMIDVANELKLPSYVFFTSSAAFLGLKLHVFNLKEENNLDVTDYKDSDAELSVPSFINPVPAKVLPSAMLDKINGGSAMVLYTARKIQEANGIMINTFLDLESYAIKSFSDGKAPTIYPIGPIINSASKQESDDDIMNWLDNQPTSSVLFLCFGSYGCFNEDQVKEIAHALERSGYRFLWSLRRPPPSGKMDAPAGYENPDEVLPEGFLDRTSSIGKVVGWAPQIAVLSHPYVGGFISHCGWNSILETIWFGVPIAAWPLYAEQQVNAFEITAELGLAVNIKMEYKVDTNQLIVTAEEIERAIRHLMMNDGENDKRKKIKDLQEKSRRALTEGGSSYNFLGRLINDILQNISKKHE